MQGNATLNSLLIKIQQGLLGPLQIIQKCIRMNKWL